MVAIHRSLVWPGFRTRCCPSPTTWWRTSVIMPAGQHRVDLRFTGARPDPLGVVLTLAGLLALALLRRGGRGR
jgi:hypothetical protein